MRDLLSLAFKATGNNYVRIFQMPNSPVFWEKGKLISIEKAIEKMKELNPTIEFQQITLGELYEHQLKELGFIYNREVFKNDDEKFNFWLRVLCEYDSSNVDEKTYKFWYNHLNSGTEVVFL